MMNKPALNNTQKPGNSNAYASLDDLPAGVGSRPNGKNQMMDEGEDQPQPRNSGLAGRRSGGPVDNNKSRKPGWNDDTGVVRQDDAPPANASYGGKFSQEEERERQEEFFAGGRGGGGVAGNAKQAPGNKQGANKQPPRVEGPPKRREQYYDDEQQQQDGYGPSRPSNNAHTNNNNNNNNNGKQGLGGMGIGSRRPPPPQSMPPQDEDVEDEREEELRREEEAKREAAERLNAEMEETAENQEDLVPCGICGRNFRESVVARHEAACQKASKQRKVFDMKKQRADGVEGLKEAQKEAARDRKKGLVKEKPASVMPKWKLQHLQFQQAMAAAHGTAPAVAQFGGGGGGGGMGGGEDPLAGYDGRVPCPHCGRKFAEDTAERHIPKCTANRPAPMKRR